VGLENDLSGAGKAIVDEAAHDAVELDPEAKALIDHFLEGLKGLIVGREVTVAITVK
jgi:hypothetical protein